MNESHRILPRSGVGFPLSKGERLVISDPEGSQVADLLAFGRFDVREVISNGRTLDYEAVSYTHLTLPTKRIV